jgi:hypothetical protein
MKNRLAIPKSCREVKLCCSFLQQQLKSLRVFVDVAGRMKFHSISFRCQWKAKTAFLSSKGVFFTRASKHEDKEQEALAWRTGKRNFSSF